MSLTNLAKGNGNTSFRFYSNCLLHLEELGTWRSQKLGSDHKSLIRNGCYAEVTGNVNTAAAERMTVKDDWGKWNTVNTWNGEFHTI